MPKPEFGMSARVEEEHANIMPHYEVPNLTSMLYDYTNKEQERIA